MTNIQTISHSAVEMFFPRTRFDHILFLFKAVNEVPISFRIKVLIFKSGLYQALMI